MTEDSAKVVEAQRFVLRDFEGRIRAALGAETNGSVALRIYDGENRRRIELVVASSGGVGLQIWDEDNQARVVLGLDSPGPHVATPALSLIGKDGKGGVELAVGQNGVSFLEIFKDGQTLFRIPDSAQVDGEKEPRTSR
jgi:hypothetical protein